MLYNSIRQLIEDVVEFQEDTPSTLYGASTERENRLAHYYDRAAEELWQLRPWWEFKHATTVLTLLNGQAALPRNFGGVGTEGYVVPSPSGSGQLPWVDVNYQELIAMRNNNVWPARYQQNRVYAIGAAVDAVFSVTADVSSPSGSQYTLQASDSEGFLGLNLYVGAEITIAGFVNAGNNGLFTIVTETTEDEQYLVSRNDAGSVGAGESSVAITVTFTAPDTLSILSGNPADDRSITMYHDTQLVRTDVGNEDLDAPIPFPGYCHHALYAGTTWHANRSKNDRREKAFRLDFDRAMSQAVIAGRPKRTRPQQLPMSVGRMW